jgi:hypothetical protein
MDRRAGLGGGAGKPAGVGQGLDGACARIEERAAEGVGAGTRPRRLGIEKRDRRAARKPLSRSCPRAPPGSRPEKAGVAELRAGGIVAPAGLARRAVEPVERDELQRLSTPI